MFSKRITYSLYRQRVESVHIPYNVTVVNPSIISLDSILSIKLILSGRLNLPTNQRTSTGTIFLFIQ